MTWSKYGDWETRGEKIDATVYPVASIHHFHGDTCLCGAKSGTARGRTEHIIDRTLAALAENDMLPDRADGEHAASDAALYEALRHLRVVEGAEFDILNGRNVMDATEERSASIRMAIEALERVTTDT